MVLKFVHNTYYLHIFYLSIEPTQTTPPIDEENAPVTVVSVKVQNTTVKDNTAAMNAAIEKEHQGYLSQIKDLAFEYNR